MGASTSFDAAPSVVPFVEPHEAAAALWLKLHEERKRRLVEKPCAVVLLGDSRTEGWGRQGKEAFASILSGSDVAHAGSGGDRAQHILWRVQQGELDGSASSLKAVYLLAGINNLQNSDPPETSARVVLEVADALRERYRVHVGIQLEWPSHPSAAVRQATLAFNHALHALTSDQKQYAGWCSLVELEPFGGAGFWHAPPEGDAADTPDPAGPLPDGVHPSEAGYEAWAQTLVPLLAQLVAQRQAEGA